jgi:hypothetical protein
MSSTVHVLSIDHKYGTTTFANATAEGLSQAFYLWVKDQWGDDGLPDDHNEAIETYFDDHPDDTYWVDIVEVGP